MRFTREQLEKIISEAPEWATNYGTVGKCGVFAYASLNENNYKYDYKNGGVSLLTAKVLTQQASTIGVSS